MSANAIIGIDQRVTDTARPVEAGPCAGLSSQNKTALATAQRTIPSALIKKRVAGD